MTFNEKLVKLRKLKGITQDELASAVGVSRQAVYKWESGQSYPEVPKLIEMKLLFGISIDNLLDESYEVILPEKKVRKKKAANTAAEKKIENAETVSIENTEQKEVEETPVTALTEEKGIPVSEITEQIYPEKKAPEEKTEEKTEKKTEEKKRGLFARIFGR